MFFDLFAVLDVVLFGKGAEFVDEGDGGGGGTVGEDEIFFELFEEFFIDFIEHFF